MDCRQNLSYLITLVSEVDRGFNDGKSLNHDNVSEELLVALRTVFNRIKFYKLKHHEVEMTSSLLYSCKKRTKDTGIVKNEVE